MKAFNAGLFSFHRSFRKTIAGLFLAVSLMACNPHSSWAAQDEVDHYDARVQAYDPDVELKSSSTGGSWILMVMLGVLCVAVIFKDAKRSHLD